MVGLTLWEWIPLKGCIW